MVTRNYETKTYTKTEKVLVSEKRFCDCCGKEITGPFWKVTTGHHDWGNDSHESIEEFDACSTLCLSEMFNDYENRSEGEYNTEYIEVNHRVCAHVKGDVEYDEN